MTARILIESDNVRMNSKEPALHYGAFGWYFVEYSDGNVSMLMSRRVAKEYASMFGGKLRRHSKTPWHAIGYVPAILKAYIFAVGLVCCVMTMVTTLQFMAGG